MSEEEAAAPDPRDLFGRVGTVLDGKYKILKVLGQGGMGVVYKALHLELEEPCAIKCLTSTDARDPQALDRFKQEALILRRLNVPGLVRVFDFVRPPSGPPYIVMEFLDGAPFSAQLEGGRSVDWKTAFKVVLAAAEALAPVHARGIVHRDLKPENFFVCRDGRIVLLDFGVAHMQSDGHVHTRTGLVYGTPHYLSPEMVDGQKAEPRDDIYALGVVLYHAITGRPIYSAPDQLALVMMIKQRKEPVPITTLVPGLPPSVAHVVRKAMALTREDRFASTPVFCEVLRASLGKDDVSLTLEPSARTILSVPQPVVPRTREDCAPDAIATEETVKAKSGPQGTAILDEAAPLAPMPTPAPGPFVAAVASLPSSSGAVLAPSAGFTPPPTEAPVPRSGRRGLAVMLGVIAAVGLAAASWLAFAHKRPSQGAPPAIANSVAPVPVAPAPPAVTFGHVKVVTTPSGATVVREGQIVGRTPIDLRGQVNETTTIRVELDGYAPKEETVMFTKEGGEADVELKPAEAEAPTPAPKEAHASAEPGHAKSPTRKIHHGLKTTPTTHHAVDETTVDPF